METVMSKKADLRKL